MDKGLQIKLYDPQQRLRAPRIKNEQWEKYRHHLEELHVRSYTRAQMRDWLVSRGFAPSLKQLNEKMTTWGFRRYGCENMIFSFAENEEGPLGEGPSEAQFEEIYRSSTGQFVAGTINNESPTMPDPVTGARSEEDEPVDQQHISNALPLGECLTQQSSNAKAEVTVQRNIDEILADVTEFVAKHVQYPYDTWSPLQMRADQLVGVTAVDHVVDSKASTKCLSIETHSSWSFHRVTGFPKGGTSTIRESLNESIVGSEHKEDLSQLDRASNVGSDTRNDRMQYYHRNM